MILGMKTQDTEGALLDLEASAGGIEPPIICAQNGVENEPRALRRFPRVYGMVARLPGTYLEAGVIENHARPVGGLLDVGRYPEGSDELIEQVSADLQCCNFGSRVEPRIMRWKYAKLIRNLANGLVGCVGIEADVADFRRALVDEALACYVRRGPRLREPGRGGRAPRRGRLRDRGDRRQPAARQLELAEPDPRHRHDRDGLPQRRDRDDRHPAPACPRPYNRVVQRVSAWMARERKQPGALTVEDLERMVEQEKAATAG